MHEDERGDAHEGSVAVGALPIAAAATFEGGRRGVSNVEGASIRRVCALIEPVAEAPPHILDIDFAAFLQACARGEQQRRVIRERPRRLSVNPALGHSRALEGVPLQKLVGHAKGIPPRPLRRRCPGACRFAVPPGDQKRRHDSQAYIWPSHFAFYDNEIIERAALATVP